MLAFFSSKSKSQFIKLNKPKPCSSVYSAKHLGIVRNRKFFINRCVILLFKKVLSENFINGHHEKWLTEMTKIIDFGQFVSW